MNTVKYHAAFLHLFLVEMAFALSIYLFLNIHNSGADRNHILFFLTIILIQYATASLIVRKLPAKYIYLLVPVTLAAALFAGDYFLSALMISTIPVWRLEQLHYSLDDTFAPGSLVAGLVWLIIITLINTPEIEADLDTFNIIFIASLTAYIIGKILILAMSAGFGRWAYFRLVSSCVLVFTVLSALVTGVYKVAVFALSYAVIFMLNAVVFLLRPFFDFLEGVELEYPEGVFEEDEAALDGYQSPEAVMSETSQVLGIPFGGILLAAVVIAVIFALWSYFRKRDTEGREDVYSHQKPNTASHTAGPTRSKKAPAERGRKMYFDFEKWAASKGFGRYSDETIEQWFRRLSLDAYSPVSKLEHYQEMRYRDKELTDEELEKLKAIIREFKDILNKKA